MAFSLPCPKVLLHLPSTQAGKHKLSPFEIITGHPLHLDEGLIKGDLLHYCKDFINTLLT